MIGLSVILDGDGAFKDIAHLLEPKPALLERVVLLQMGTANGKPSVAVLLKKEDGNYLMGETTLELLKTAVAAMVARTEMLERSGGGLPT